MRSYISNVTLEEIVRRLVEGLQPEQIILFGSYAYGQPLQNANPLIGLGLSLKGNSQISFFTTR